MHTIENVIYDLMRYGRYNNCMRHQKEKFAVT